MGRDLLPLIGLNDIMTLSVATKISLEIGYPNHGSVLCGSRIQSGHKKMLTLILTRGTSFRLYRDL